MKGAIVVGQQRQWNQTYHSNAQSFSARPAPSYPPEEKPVDGQDGIYDEDGKGVYNGHNQNGQSPGQQVTKARGAKVGQRRQESGQQGSRSQAKVRKGEKGEEDVGVHQPEINGRDASRWGGTNQKQQPSQPRGETDQQIGDPAHSPPAYEKSNEKVGHHQERQSAEQTSQMIGQYQRQTSQGREVTEQEVEKV